MRYKRIQGGAPRGTPFTTMTGYLTAYALACGYHEQWASLETLAYDIPIISETSDVFKGIQTPSRYITLSRKHGVYLVDHIKQDVSTVDVCTEGFYRKAEALSRVRCILKKEKEVQDVQ